MSDARFDRNEQLFGTDGQQKLRDQKIMIIGVGGLGSHVLQQLAYLGVGAMVIIDGETLDVTNKNRYVTARHADPNEGLLKVDAARRLVQDIDPRIRITTIADHFPDAECLLHFAETDCVFGCVDDDKARFIVNEVAASHNRLYIDLASEVLTEAPMRYGGRVFVSMPGTGCLICRDLLDVQEIANGFRTDAERRDREALYGISASHAASGPSVVSINAVVASLAVTEFMVAVTELRAPVAQLTYRADRGVVTVSTDTASDDCFYCHGLRAGRASTDIARYLPSRRKSAA